jgi:hypothetical protein
MKVTKPRGEKHLWEVKHDYYCNEGNYYASKQPYREFKNWADFMEEFGDSDMDMNLLFRWDWNPIKYAEDDETPVWSKDDNYRDGQLLLFWMGQRKGLYQWSVVEVCKADEPEIIKFLEPRLKHLMKLWEPLK